ncbi:hypothetical protein Gorai_015889, partial [Gossypium raimondii]|nr:hypothetical protein [Gossypium raimondii]
QPPQQTVGLENFPAILRHGNRFIGYDIYGKIFEVTAKYIPPIEPIGMGGYGIVWDIIPPLRIEYFNDVYSAYELMDTDLHQLIHSNQALSEEHCQ